MISMSHYDLSHYDLSHYDLSHGTCLAVKISHHPALNVLKYKNCEPAYTQQY